MNNYTYLMNIVCNNQDCYYKLFSRPYTQHKLKHVCSGLLPWL